MISLAIGIAVGAAFSPFWMKLYGLVKDWVSANKPK